jgi:hypothetical protein
MNTKKSSYSHSPNWGKRFPRPMEPGKMISSAGGKSAGQLEQIGPVGRLDGIREEHLGQKNEDTEAKVKTGNGVDGEKFKQINITSYSRH